MAIQHLVKDQPDWIVPINQLIDQVGDGLNLVHNGDKGITALNGFDASTSDYYTIKLKTQTLVLLHMELEHTSEEAEKQYYQIQAAQLPDNIRPTHMVSTPSPTIRYDNPQPRIGMYISLSPEGHVYVGSYDSTKVTGLIGYHGTLIYLTNN